MIRFWFTLAALLILSQFTSAQEKKPLIPNGKFSGEVRTFLMGTINKGDLKDFSALGVGGYVKYVHTIKRFRIGGALYANWNTNIQDLSVPDPISGRISRYESGLFDVDDLGNKLFVLPGELFVSYTAPHHSVTLGRMKIKTPFLNGQDGRMIPTLEQGIWYTYQDSSSLKLNFGVFNAISPRGTSRFSQIGETFGVYPVGRNSDGSRSGYKDHTDSDFIIVAGGEVPVSKDLNLEVWDYFVDNVFNSVFIRPSYKVPNSKVTLAFEWLHQDRVGDGGNPFDSLRYFTDKSADVIGAQIAYKMKSGTLSLGYNRIFAHGRYLFPREWGREFLFTFQKRERSEGTADNHALMLSYDSGIKLGASKVRTIYSVGRQWKPSVLEPAANKYAIPGYTHFNFDLFFTSEKLPQFRPEILVTYKMNNADNLNDNPNFIINKVDMWNLNLILNYRF